MNRTTARLLLAPGLGLILLVFFLPFGLLLMTSVWSQAPGSLIVKPDLSFESYRRIFADAFYLRALGRTIGLSLATVVVCLILGFPTAFWIARRAGSWRRLAMALMLLPVVCGALLPTLGLVNLLSPLGVVNGFLKSVGLIGTAIPFLGTMGGILLGLTQSFLPLMVLPLVVVLDRLPPAYEEAAMSLGARPGRVWRHVVIPLCLPGIGAGSVLVFCAALTSFVTPQILGQGKVATFAAVTWQQASLVLDWPFASALAVVMLGLMALVAGTLAVIRFRWREQRT